MSSIVLKIDRKETKKASAKFVYKDIDAFSDKYSDIKIDLLTDSEAVKESVRNILQWNQGEEILYPKFGNSLRKYLYQPLDDINKSELVQEVRRALEDNEPRIRIVELGVVSNDNDETYSTVTLSIRYRVLFGDRDIQNKIITDTITIGDKTITKN